MCTVCNNMERMRTVYKVFVGKTENESILGIYLQNQDYFEMNLKEGVKEMCWINVAQNTK